MYIFFHGLIESFSEQLICDSLFGIKINSFHEKMSAGLANIVERKQQFANRYLFMKRTKTEMINRFIFRSLKMLIGDSKAQIVFLIDDFL